MISGEYWLWLVFAHCQCGQQNVTKHRFRHWCSRRNRVREECVLLLYQFSMEASDLHVNINMGKYRVVRGQIIVDVQGDLATNSTDFVDGENMGSSQIRSESNSVTIAFVTALAFLPIVL